MKRKEVVVICLILVTFVYAQFLIAEEFIELSREDLSPPIIFLNDSNFEKIIYKESEEIFTVYILTFHSEDLLIEKINYTLDEIDRIVTKDYNGSYISIYENYIEWISKEKIIHIEGSGKENIINSDLLSDYLIKYQSNTNDYVKKLQSEIFSTNIIVLASDCDKCGEGWFDNCEKDECYDLGSSCYLGWASCTGFGDCYCYDGSSLQNGNDAYCNYKGQRENGCDYEEYDCDFDNQCSGSLDCVDFDGGVCLLGLECGCCNVREKWNTQMNKCYIRMEHEDYDCDSNYDCKPGLICDGNTPVTDLENEGCCYAYENWNTNDFICNKAVNGEIYSVTQVGNKFIDSKYVNLKLRVFVEDDDLIEDDVVDFFDIYVDSNGNFKFNPERHITWWNNPPLLVDYKIDSIFAIEGNEIIGKWTNKFSNKETFQYAEDWVEQIIRIHKDKKTWRKVKFPELDSTTILSTNNYNTLDSNEEYVHLKWNGLLNLSNIGEYKLLFNSTGSLKLSINNITLIDTEKRINEEKLIGLIIKNKSNNLEFELLEKASSIPRIYLSYNNSNFIEVDRSILIKKETQIKFINKKEDALFTNDIITNTQPDYIISFLEKPKTIRKQKPLIFVHGKHGESGYWSENNSQEYFNNKGYDAWEFYYPGDDYINMSGALLGDALDYLKRNYYNSSQKFDLITHSMGGLVARSYVQNISPYSYKNDINHLMMIGSPNYGSGGASGVNFNWYYGILSYRYFEGLYRGDQEIYKSPIYQQMSLGSEFVKDLEYTNISNINALIVTGNKNSVDFKSINSWLCSIIDNIGHKEGDDNEQDCLVSIASSSLLNNNIPIAILSDKNHVTEVDRITDYSNLITSFLLDSPDSTLAFYSYAYHNSKTGYKKNFNYKEGSVQIRLLENDKIWNENSYKDLQIRKLDSPHQGFIFNLTRNIQSKNYFHFNRKSGVVDSFYTIPAGNYKLIILGYEDDEKLRFTVKPMETNFLIVELSEMVSDIPSLSILSPQNNSIINSSNIFVMFNTSNWNIGGKGDKHIHFHVEGIPGLSFSDHLMFYNGDDKIVEFNFQNGKNPFASWVNKNTIRLNNLSNGKYKVRAHLATESHQPPGNKEADVIISFIVNVSKEDGLCTINAPLNNLISKERKIDFDIIASEKLASIEYLDQNDRIPRWRNLCRNCNKYDKGKSFSDGEHNIFIRCNNFFGNKKEHEKKIIVDSKTPRISKTEPSRRFASSIFNVEFTEENPTSLILFYGNSIKNKSLNIKNDCNLDRTRYICKKQVNLSDFDGQEIRYWFELTDIVGNKDVSRENSLKVDTLSPILNSFNYLTNNKRVEFIFNISEENFDEITYIDHTDSKPRERRLCSRLRDSICQQRKTFKSGHHELTIFVKDKAGNVLEKNIFFMV